MKTNDTKHTPGPWNFVSTPSATWRVKTPDGNSSPIVIANLPNYDEHDRLAEGETQANARLIAAGPELLEALTELAALADFTRPTERAAWIKARAAIAKATGQS